ncbi:DUF928 domain-containing protein [Altericista sp. CCNU0014]|uniref:DUF928 domain-containing protein n=1 Tax=Altericista sp. CCNU0014 TaxID=3082949 RepID=UPI00384EF030
MSNHHHSSGLVALGLLLIATGTAFATPLPAKMPANEIARGAIARGRVSAPKVLFKPPARDRRPDRTVGAGSRGRQCPQDLASAPTSSELARQLPLMALVPPSNIGLTMAERPTFWVHLPQTSARQVVLSVQKEDASYHSQWVFPVPSSSGIFSLQPPADAPPLKIGESYQWAVVLVCGERPGPNDPAVAAWVQRVSPSESIVRDTALDRASWNGEQGLWYDMLTVLAQELRSQPANPDLTGTWASVLKSEGLDIVSMEPLRFE